MIAARIGSLAISITSIILALGAQTLNVAFLVSLAFCIAASVNLPVITYTIYWRRFNTNGAVWALLGGLFTALVLVAISPNVWNPEAGKAIFTGTPLISLTNPAIISVPVGFICGWIGTLLSKEKDFAKYNEVEVRAQTGISVNDVSH